MREKEEGGGGPELSQGLVERLDDLAEKTDEPELHIAARLVELAYCRAQARVDLRFRWNKLSYRQQEIALLIHAGCKYAEIACRLNIGLATVRTHARYLYKKMGVRGKADLRATMLRTEVLNEYLEAYKSAANTEKAQAEEEG
jgi:DNA-binding NarL/FixJ family response regulator